MIYGLDIGGTKIEIAVFDEQFALAERWRVATPTTDYDEFLDTVHAQVALADAKFGAKAPVMQPNAILAMLVPSYLRFIQTTGGTCQREAICVPAVVNCVVVAQQKWFCGLRSW